MKKTENDWAIAEPYINILWLHNIIDKMTSSDGVKYKTKPNHGVLDVVNLLIKCLDHAKSNSIFRVPLNMPNSYSKTMLNSMSSTIKILIAEV